MATTTQYYLIAFVLFIIGIIVGRLSMAIQYAYLKKFSQVSQEEQKEKH